MECSCCGVVVTAFSAVFSEDGLMCTDCYFENACDAMGDYDAEDFDCERCGCEITAVGCDAYFLDDDMAAECAYCWNCYRDICNEEE